MRFETIYVIVISIFAYIWTIAIHLEKSDTLIKNVPTVQSSSQKTYVNVGTDIVNLVWKFIWMYILTYIWWLFSEVLLNLTYGFIKGVKQIMDGQPITNPNTTQHMVGSVAIFIAFILCISVFLFLVIINNVHAWSILLVTSAFLALFVFLFISK
jgi:hypothetical protein